MKVLLVSDIWPNNILGRYATYYKNKGHSVHRKLNNPDLIIASWNFNKNKNQKCLDQIINKTKTIEGGAFVNPEIKAPDYISRLCPDYDFLNIDYGIGRLTIGCPNNCPWCLVPKIWGLKTTLYDKLKNFINPKSNNIMLLDDNIFTYKKSNQLLESLSQTDYQFSFQSGVDLRNTNYKNAAILSRIKYRSRNFKDKIIYVAFDDTKEEKKIEKGIKILQSFGIKLRGYALGGYPDGKGLEDLIYRVEKLIEWGVEPYVMPFKNFSKITKFKRCVSIRKYKKIGIRESWKRYEFR